MKLWAAENERNAANSELFTSIIREAYEGVSVAVAAHHLIFTRDGVTDEFPSADTLMFDHDVAKTIWGEEDYKEVLTQLALEPVETRDELLSQLYYAGGRPTP